MEKNCFVQSISFNDIEFRAESYALIYKIGVK